MLASKFGLYAVLFFGFVSASSNGIAQVFTDIEVDRENNQNCNEWWSFDTSSGDASNQQYFNNVFGQYSAYPDLDSLPADKQCIWLNDGIPVGWSYNWPEITDRSSGTQRYAVKAFPEIIYGEKGEFSDNPNKVSNADSGFPIKAVDVIEGNKLIDVKFAYREYLVNEVGRNVVIEAFFHDVGGDCSAIRGDNRALEIMIWTERPSDEFTLTENNFARGVSIGGYTWNVYSRKTPQDYIVFEATTPFSGRDIVSPTTGTESSASGSYNWNEFVKYVFDNQQALDITFDAEYCMAGLEFGTEIWFGEGQFRVDEYVVNVSEGDPDNDGVFGRLDLCPDTSVTLDVSFGSCATNVANIVQPNGCSILDELAACDVNTFISDGQYANCIFGINNNLSQNGLLSSSEMFEIMGCAFSGR